MYFVSKYKYLFTKVKHIEKHVRVPKHPNGTYRYYAYEGVYSNIPMRGYILTIVVL